MKVIIKKTGYFLLWIGLIVLTASWGYQGHYLISFSMADNLPAELDIFADWNDYLAEHASDADNRKGEDPEEAPKHYIDIDNYQGFIDDGYIETNLDSLEAKYGASFVGDNGYLPWATKTAYDSLFACFLRNDLERAKFFAADLGHYVADGHMPLHITRNYNGQYSGNDGIHYRYESGMINTYVNEIQMQETGVTDIEEVMEYIFNYIYSNYSYVDSVLLADDYAKSINPDVNSDAYYEALWAYSEEWTEIIFNKAAASFASLFYHAYNEAIKIINSTQPTEKNHDIAISVFPNPVQGNLKISFDLDPETPYRLELYDYAGKKMATITEDICLSYNTRLNYNTQELNDGAYILVLETGNTRYHQKIIIAN